MRLTTTIVATSLLLTGVARAQQSDGSPALPPLPAAPAPSLPPIPGVPRVPASLPSVAPVDTGDSNPAPACSTAMITDKVFDFTSKKVSETYRRSLYGKVMNVTETESRGTRRKCSGEMSDSDGWTYPVTYVLNKPAADEVDISYDFSRIKPPPKLAVAPDPVVPPSALPAAPGSVGPPVAIPAGLPPVPAR